MGKKRRVKMSRALSLKQKYFLISWSILLLFCMEFSIRLFYKNDDLEEIKEVIQEDQDFFWRNRANLSTTFKGKIVNTDEKGFRIIKDRPLWEKSERRILILGPSPCFGFGVEDYETYSYLLQEQYNFSKKNVSIINASQIGFSSFQGKKLYFDILKNVNPKPTEIIISYVVNDLDHYRFFNNNIDSDKNVKPNKLWKIKFNHLLSNFKIYKILERIILGLNNKNPVKVVERFRVPVHDYEDNLKEMIIASKQLNIKVWLLKFPLKLPNTSETKIINENIHFYHEALDKIANEMKVDVIDVVTPLQDSKTFPFIDPKMDTFHPNKLGHEIIKNEILKVIK